MKIYKIVTPHSPKCYVGKTTQKLSARFTCHKVRFRYWQDLKVRWCSSFGLLWLGDCSIEVLEETEDDQAERKWIVQLDCVNTYRMEYGVGDQRNEKARAEVWNAKRRNYTAAERVIGNAKQKAYYEANRALIAERAKVRIICDRCGTETSMTSKSTHQRTKKCQTIYAAKTYISSNEPK